MRGRSEGTRPRAVVAAIRTSTSQTFEVREAASRSAYTSVTAQPLLRCVSLYMVDLFALDSSSIRACAWLLRRLRALSRSSGAGLCTQPASQQQQQQPPPPQQQQQQQQRRCAERSKRPQSPRARPCLPSALCLPATHSSPACAGRCGRRHRATPSERGPSPASGGRHRRARRRGRTAVASRPHAAERAPESVAGGRAARRARTCVGSRACMLRISRSAGP
jgi:hypothetical protein